MGRTPKPPRLWLRPDNKKWYVIFWDHEAKKRRYRSCDEEHAITAALRKDMLGRYKRVEIRSAAAAIDRPAGTDYDRNLIEAVRLYLRDASAREAAGDLADGSLKKLHDTLDKLIVWLPPSLTTGTLNPRHLENFLREVSASLSGNTLNTYRQNIGSCLRWLAKERPKLFPEPDLFWDSLAKKSVQRTELLAYTPQQLQTFYARIPGDVQRLFKLTALTGGRASEVENIQWSDIDLNTGRLTIMATKTHRRRYLPMKEIAPMLLAEMQTWDKSVPPAFYERSRFWWWDYSRSTGIAVNPQRLRRNFASWALACGKVPPVVGQWMGHSMRVLEDWYAQQVLELVDATSIQSAMGL